MVSNPDCFRIKLQLLFQRKNVLGLVRAALRNFARLVLSLRYTKEEKVIFLVNPILLYK